MASDQRDRAIVIMGVSGAGKSIVLVEFFLSWILIVYHVLWRTIGKMLAKVLSCTFLDADDFHPQSNKEKMTRGVPLSEEDRIPWLEVLRDTLRECLIYGKIVVLGCSSLQKQYREILRCADPNYKPGSYDSALKFILLDAAAEVIVARLLKRAEEGKHFMSTTLLQSQLDLLQIDDSEGIFKVDGTLSPEEIISTIRAHVLD